MYLLDRTPRALHPAALPVLIAVVVGVIPLPAAWPYWVGHPIPAVLAVLLSGSLAGAGLLLAQRAGSPRTGLLLLAASVLFAIGWVLARDTGAYPLIGEYTQSVFFLALGAGILLHGRARFDRWYEWAWTIEAFVILIFSQTAICLTVAPERLGYSPDVLWFNLDVPERIGSAVTEAGAISYVVLALTFVWVLVLQQRRPGPRNSTAMLVVSAIFAVTAAVVQYPIMGTDSSVPAIMAARGAQGTTAIILPLTLFAGALRSAWLENRVAAQLLTLIGHATPESVRSGLRVVLRDPELEVWYWIPGAAAFVDTAGRLRRTASGLQIRTPGGGPLAVCALSTAQAEHDPTVRIALEASSSALQAVQLQLVHAEEMRDIQDRLMAAEDDGRKELARDLHDGVQQELAALRLQLVGLLGQVPPGATLERLADCNDRVVAVIEQVRSISRGLHPTSLAHDGLAGALEEAAEGFGRRIRLDVPARRFAPRIELAMYYILSEALTNVMKHAQAESVHVRVDVRDDAIIGEVVDDGRGGATVTLGGGLHGVEDRVRALRGRLELASRNGHGTRLTVTIPLIGAA
ncbi:sensor histidine kinase [Actinoplanes solisilvae]|uniref:sensor histidine kinase n=1 Tax=Actinoplanes solisilvae TaxID=2486853 RepID=UPI0013E3AC59|nr:sensor histidine kinase [Actinoplanes solisilvae]